MGAPAVAPSEARAALASAHRFLDGYVPFSYGHASAKSVHAASARLSRELERSPPRVPPTVARARPTVLSIRAAADLSHHVLAVLAVVDDGQRRYHITLELRQARGAWLVTAVGA